MYLRFREHLQMQVKVAGFKHPEVLLFVAEQ
jgi:hypothetical protein